MIEGIVLAAFASATATAPVVRRKEENIVIVRMEQSASTEQAVENVLNNLLAGTVTTYQFVPPSVGQEDVPFVSPLTSSFTVKAKLRVGGEIVQPPIDFDNIIYFDE